MVTMISVMPHPSEKAPVPMLTMIGTAWIQMMEKANFVPDKIVKVPASEAGAKQVELHQSSAPAAPPVPIPATLITMHNGATLMVQEAMDQIKGMIG